MALDSPSQNELPMTPTGQQDRLPTDVFDFLRLPREARDNIYRHIFQSTDYRPNLQAHSVPELYHDRLNRVLCPAIFLTSRQCHNEAAAIYYGNCFFVSHHEVTIPGQGVDFVVFDDFCKHIGWENAALIRKVSAKFGVNEATCWHSLQFLGHLIRALPGLRWLQVTLEPRMVVTGPAVSQAYVARAQQLAETLPAPESESQKWIRRWVTDQKYLHFWYVPKSFKMTRWDSDITKKSEPVEAGPGQLPTGREGQGQTELVMLGGRR